MTDDKSAALPATEAGRALHSPDMGDLIVSEPKGLVEQHDSVTVSIELVRVHSGSSGPMPSEGSTLPRWRMVPPHTERGPYRCGCTTCDGVFVLVRATCSGNCGCELVNTDSTQPTYTEVERLDNENPDHDRSRCIPHCSRVGGGVDRPEGR